MDKIVELLFLKSQEKINHKIWRWVTALNVNKKFIKKSLDLPEKDVELNPWKVDSSDNDEQGEYELDNLGPATRKQIRLIQKNLVLRAYR